ncbi:MAG: RNA 2',3'-cyclic phosphodiesterase [Promethearchaeota archaeon]
MVRLFISVDLENKDLLKSIRQFQTLISQFPIRLVKVELLHFTLKFIGEKSDDWIPRLKEGLETISFSPFKLELEGAGFFPPRGNPRIVWIGVSKGKDEIISLAREIDLTIADLGLPKEKRPFSPHLTIARAKHGKNVKPLIPYLTQNQPEVLGQIDITEFRLKKSTLIPSGPIYETLVTFPVKM